MKRPILFALAFVAIAIFAVVVVGPSVDWRAIFDKSDDPAGQFVRGMSYCGQFCGAADDASKDMEQAAYWFEKAAEQGYAAAQRILGQIYLAGQGAERDYAEAYKWSELAASQGHEGAIGQLEYLKGMMTMQQITEGERRVREWREQR